MKGKKKYGKANTMTQIFAIFKGPERSEKPPQDHHYNLNNRETEKQGGSKH